MVKKEIETKVAEILQKNYPEFFDEFRVVIQSNKELPDADDIIIANWQQIAFTELSRFLRTPASLSNFWVPVYQIAKSFEEKKLMQELKEIYAGDLAKKFGKTHPLSLCNAEAIAFKETFMPSDKKYLLEGDSWRPSEIISYAKACLQQTASILNEVLRLHSINAVPIEMGHITTEMVKEAGMPMMPMGAIP